MLKHWIWPLCIRKVWKTKIFVSEVGFEPTPSFEDQNAHFTEAKSISLESGALDRSAILTWLQKMQFLLVLFFNNIDMI